ncbi:MAG: hypothetical protein WC683_07985 [bacterium]
MAMTAAELRVVLSAKDEMSAVLNKARSSLQGLGGETSGFAGKASGASGAAKSVGAAMGGLGSAASGAGAAMAGISAKTVALGTALGQLALGGISAAANALKNNLGASYTAVADQQRMQASLGAMVTKELMKGTTEVVAAGQVRVQLTAKETEKLQDLQQAVREHSNAVSIQEQKTAAALANGKLSAAQKEKEVIALDKVRGKLSEEQAAMAALTAKSNQLVNVTKSVTTGQLDLNAARDAAAPIAADLLRWVEKMGAQSPFESGMIGDALKTSMAFGATREEAKGLVTQLVDFAAATGKSDQVIQQLGLVMGQIRGKGKLMGDDMLQLVGAGVPVNDILARMGKQLSDVSEGTVGAAGFFKAFGEEMKGSGFEGAAKDQATSLAGLGSTIKETMNIVKRDMSKGVWEALQGPMASFLNVLTDEKNMTAIAAFGKRIGAGLTAGMSKAQSAAASAQKAFSAVGGGAKGIKAGAISVLPDLLGADAPKAAAVIGPVLDFITGKVETFAARVQAVMPSVLQVFNTLSANIGPIMATLGPVFAQAGGMITTALGQIAPVVASVIGTIITWIVGNLPLIRDTVASVMTSIQAIWNAVWPALGQVIQTVVPLVLDIIKAMMPVFAQVFSVIATVVKAVMPVVVSVITTIADIIRENLPAIQTIISTSMDIIFAVFNAVWPAIQAVVTTVMGAIQVIVSTVINVIQGILTAVMQAIQGDWAGAWQTLQNTVSAFKETVEGYLRIFQVQLRTLWFDMIAELKAVWVDAWAIIGQTARDAWDAIKAFFSGLPAQMQRLGEDMFNGLKEGLTRKAQELADGAKRLIANIIGGMRDEANSHSPSKETWQIAIDLVNGLVGGLDQGTRDALSAATDLIGKVLGVFSQLSNMKGGPAAIDWAAWGNAIRDGAVTAARAMKEAEAIMGANTLNETGGEAGIADKFAKLFGVMPDFSKIALPKEMPDLERWGALMAGVAIRVVEVIRAVEAAIGPDVLMAATGVADTFSKLFAIIGADLAKLQVPDKFPDLTLWGALAAGAAIRAAEVIMAVKAKIGDTMLSTAAGLADNVKKLFDILGVQLTAVVPPAPTFVPFLTAYLAALEVAAPLIANALLRVKAGFADKALGAAAEVGGQIKSIFEVLSLGEMLKGLKDFNLNASETAVGGLVSWLYKFVAAMKAAVGVLVPALVSIGTQWGDALTRAVETANKIKAVMEAIAGVVVAQNAAAETGIDAALIGELVRQLNAAGAMIGTGGVPAGMATTPTTPAPAVGTPAGGDQAQGVQPVTINIFGLGDALLSSTTVVARLAEAVNILIGENYVPGGAY